MLQSDLREHYDSCRIAGFRPQVLLRCSMSSFELTRKNIAPCG